jgi:hypothetical protein
MTAALASARAAYAALRALDTEIAGIQALTPRKGRAQARASRIADLERIRGRRVTELRTACAAMWAGLDADDREWTRRWVKRKCATRLTDAA